MQPKSLKNKLNIFLVILFTTLPSVAFARVTCTGANIGGFSSAFSSQEAAQGWVADSVTFDEYTVNYFWNYENRIGQKHQFKFFWQKNQWTGKYNPVKKQLRISMSATQGTFRITPPLIYPNCVEGGSTGSSQNSCDAVQVAFTRSSSCQRKFIQSYLKAALLYKSSIDGQWGRGTQSAIQGASKNILRFKGDKSEDIIKALRKEAPCWRWVDIELLQ